MDEAPQVDQYGNSLSLIEKLKLLAEWSPLLGKLQNIVTASDPHAQALAVVAAIQWAAGKTGTEIDDEALEHIEAVLRSDAGKAAFAWVLKKAKGEA